VKSEKLKMKNFLWGAATSAHQAEGGNFSNDWWQFEQGGFIHDGSSSNPSCDHYHQFERDLNLLKDLGCNAYRFSVEWSRVQPKEGVFSHREIDHYHRLLDSLLERDIIPVVTLHHFTNPLWFIAKGGWEQPGAIDYFVVYVQKMAEEYSGKVSCWLTINEPSVYVLLAFLAKYWPPQKRNLLSAAKVLNRLVKAHQAAYQLIHNRYSRAQVSFAHHMTVFDSWRNNFADNTATKIFDWLWNQYFLDRVRDQLDFIGLNYYTRQRISFPFKIFPTPGKEVGFAQWEFYPQGLLRILRRLKKYQLPIIITEFGMPHGFNVSPEENLQGGVEGIRRALSEGIGLRGFFYWSLMDNFEWREGLTPRFGLYEVDYQTQERRLRRVGERYKKLIKELKAEFGL